MIIVNYVFQIIITKMANQLNLEDPSSMSLVMSISEEEEEVVVRGRPTSPEVPLQPNSCRVKVMQLMCMLNY